MSFLSSKAKRNILIALFPLGVFSFDTQASGSFSGGFNGGANNVDKQQYHQGKSVLRKKLRCEDCLLSNAKIDKKTAPSVLEKLNSGEFSEVLDDRETAALATYLIKRYHISEG